MLKECNRAGKDTCTHIGDLHAVGRGEVPCYLVSLIKATSVRVED